MATTVTREEIEGRVGEALVSFGAERDQITPDAEFAALDIDSLDLVELAQIVEDDYGIRLEEKDLKDLKTVGQAIDLIVQRASP
jgi:acyl carrier protein